MSVITTEMILDECDRIDYAIADMILALQEKGVSVPADASIGTITSLVLSIPKTLLPQ